MPAKLKKTRKNNTETTVTEQPNKVDRNLLISEAAYYIAEKKGFTPTQETENWLEAEKQIEKLLGKTSGKIVMNIQKEFDELVDVLTQQRGEIELQIHLASMDAKDEWQKTEKTWGKFVDDLDLISDDAKESGAELVQATKVIGDELKEAYQRISDRLEN